MREALGANYSALSIWAHWRVLLELTLPGLLMKRVVQRTLLAMGPVDRGANSAAFSAHQSLMSDW